MTSNRMGLGVMLVLYKDFMELLISGPCSVENWESLVGFFFCLFGFFFRFKKGVSKPVLSDDFVYFQCLVKGVIVDNHRSSFYDRYQYMTTECTGDGLNGQSRKNFFWKL